MATKDNGGGHRPCVVLVSTVTPAEITYGPLLTTLGDDVRVKLKDLEVCAGDATPPEYGFGVEVEGIKRVADEAGEESVHLVGFSAGASACLAFAAKYPERASSLALVEPPFIGREGRTSEEAAFFAESEAALSLPPAKRMGPFIGMVLGPGAAPPDPPPARLRRG